MTAVRVNRRAADRVASGHPWIFRSDITDPGSAGPGQAVSVLDPKGRPIGAAHYSTTSQIALRIYEPKFIEPDVEFYKRRITAALEFRKSVVHDSDAYRLVHSEADFLPGLIVDSYANHLSVQFLSQGMDHDAPQIVEALNQVVQPASITARNDAAARRHENLPVEKRVLAGELPNPVEIRVNGLTLFVDLLEGQKTGVFLDQRENYLAAARYARDFHPQHALDCFTSTGGFALHLAPHAGRVEAVDSSGPALALAARNRDANNFTNLDFKEADVFDLLARYSTARRHFQMIVLDPPAFAKSRSNLEAALRGYREINQRALRLLDPGGILVTCSCSHHVSEADFLGVVAQSALDAGRTVRILDRRTQSADHPILLTVPETHYLKCLIIQAV